MAAINSLVNTKPENQAFAQLQDGLNQFTEQLTDTPFLKGRMLTVTDATGKETTNIPLTTTQQSIPHKLGKAPLGYIITFQDANAVIYSATLPKISDDTKDFIKFQSSANVTANIWVF